jgi:D-sedoheptulose 7-phosphate isomerase
MKSGDEGLRAVQEITATYLQDFSRLVCRLDPRAVARVFNRLSTARDEGRMIYVAGNGGSAAIASHWGNDLGKATKVSGHKPIRVMSLTDNVPWLTALANDEGYDRVFAGQLENFARPGDVLIVISSSGNSMNLIRAVELAKSRGVSTIGFLGFDGGELLKRVDDCVLLQTEKGAYGLVEPGHDMLCHLLTKCLTEIA